MVTRLKTDIVASTQNSYLRFIRGEFADPVTIA
jgi:hypothetical protein